MGEASASELNPEPIQDLRAMRGQSVMRFLIAHLHYYFFALNARRAKCENPNSHFILLFRPSRLDLLRLDLLTSDL